MLRVTFLGTSGSIPSVERGMPSLALKYESELLLWDCGEGTQRQLMRYKVGYGSITAIFVTHPHLDHYLGITGLLETLKLSSVSPRKLPVFFPGAIDIFERYAFAAPEKIRKGELIQHQRFHRRRIQREALRGFLRLRLPGGGQIKFHEEKAHSSASAAGCSARYS